MKVQIDELGNKRNAVTNYCRQLVKDGKTGMLEVFRGDTLIFHIKDIAQAAKWMVAETKDRGPKFVPYEEFPGIDLPPDKNN